MDYDAEPITSDMLYGARRAARIDRATAARLTGLKLRTYIRQETGQTRVHPAVFRLLLVHAGYLPDPEWSGWRVIKGELWTPEGWPIGPGEARSLPLLHQLIAELQKQLRQWRPEPGPRQLELSIVGATRPTSSASASPASRPVAASDVGDVCRPGSFRPPRAG